MYLDVYAQHYVKVNANFASVMKIMSPFALFAWLMLQACGGVVMESFAMAFFTLEPGVTLGQLKSKWRQFVLEHHPDRMG